MNYSLLLKKGHISFFLEDARIRLYRLRMSYFLWDKKEREAVRKKANIMKEKVNAEIKVNYLLQMRKQLNERRAKKW